MKIYYLLIITIIILIVLLVFLVFSSTDKTVQIKSNSISNIPKVVIQTSKDDLSPEYTNVLKRKLQGWEYKHFKDEDIIKYFENNPIEEFPNIIQLFKSIKRGEHKADLFRYYYLYLNGGVYMDTDIMIYKNVDEIVKTYDYVSLLAQFNDHISQSFLASVPKNEIMYKTLKDAYNINVNKLNKDYFLLVHNLLKIVNDYKKLNKDCNIYLYKLHSQFFPLHYYSVDEGVDNKVILRHFSSNSTQKIPTKYLY